MIEIEYRDHKMMIAPLEKIVHKRDRISKRVIIEDTKGVKVLSFVSIGDNNWHIDRAKAEIDRILNKN